MAGVEENQTSTGGAGGAAAVPELQEANELGDTEGSEDGRMDEQTDEQEDTDDGVPEETAGLIANAEADTEQQDNDEEKDVKVAAAPVGVADPAADLELGLRSSDFANGEGLKHGLSADFIEEPFAALVVVHEMKSTDGKSIQLPDSVYTVAICSGFFVDGRIWDAMEAHAKKLADQLIAQQASKLRASLTDTPSGSKDKKAEKEKEEKAAAGGCTGRGGRGGRHEQLRPRHRIPQKQVADISQRSVSSVLPLLPHVLRLVVH